MYISMATAKEIAKQNRHLFQEMPHCLCDLDLFNLNAPDDNSAFNQLQFIVRCKYYSLHSFDQLKNNSTLAVNKARFSVLHNNVSGA